MPPSIPAAAHLLLKVVLCSDVLAALPRLPLPVLACLGAPWQSTSCQATVKRPVLRAQQCYGAEALIHVALLQRSKTT
jgi:hypothetical protein